MALRQTVPKSMPPIEKGGLICDAHLLQESAFFGSIAQVLESLYARFHFIAGDFGASEIDPVECCASLAKPSAGEVQLQSGRKARGKTSRPTCPRDALLANVAR